ncbi:MAG: uroporphyrinogen-III synthase [Nitrosomonas sp.]|nr:uroporphyrinogen-III synthase [Nitrosomonas sp.]
MSVAKPLTGINILVTRPEHQASNLADSIRAMGGNPVLFPVLEITDVKDLRPLLVLIERLDEFNLAIFISPNAVNRAMHLICSNRTLPQYLKIAAVGKGSADTLRHFGVDNIIIPEDRYDSEALLERGELQQMEGKRVVIFRGNGGRELLGDTLVKRGAIVEYAECYRRGKPDIDTALLLTAWSRDELNAVTITSSEGLHNLFDMVGKLGQQLLKITPLFTAHERIAQLARDLGLTIVVVTPVGDEGLLQGLLDYFQSVKRQG